MTKFPLMTLSIFLGCTLINFTASADDTSNGTTDTPKGITDTSQGEVDTSSGKNITDLSKDNWLKTITPMLPSLICKGFVNDPELKNRFDEIKMTYEQCVSSIPESVIKCQKQLYKDIPDKINTDSAASWGKSLGECIGKDFAIKYLVPKSS